MPRKIGDRILQPCAIVEARGGATSVQVRMELRCDSSDVVKYMQRAVVLGLMTVNKNTKPNWYVVVPGWREIATKTVAAPSRQVERFGSPTFHLQSVWH